MKKDKQKDKEQFVEELMGLYEDRRNENGWNNNDAFDVACWFLGDMIMQLEADHIIPRDELQRRIKQKLDVWVDNIFQQIENNDHGIVQFKIKKKSNYGKSKRQPHRENSAQH